MLLALVRENSAMITQKNKNEFCSDDQQDHSGY